MKNWIYLMVFIFISSCFNTNRGDYYALNSTVYNKIRADNNLQQIDSSWHYKIYINEDTVIEWRPIYNEKLNPYHKMKITTLGKTEKIIKIEEDIFRNKISDSSSFILSVLINIEEGSNKYRLDEHKYIEKYGRKDFFVIESSNLSNNQKDSVLDSWKIKSVR